MAANDKNEISEIKELTRKENTNIQHLNYSETVRPLTFVKVYRFERASTSVHNQRAAKKVVKSSLDFEHSHSTGVHLGLNTQVGVVSIILLLKLTSRRLPMLWQRSSFYL